MNDSKLLVDSELREREKCNAVLIDGNGGRVIGFYRLCRRPVTLGPIILQIYLPTKYDEITFHLSSGFKWKKIYILDFFLTKS
jgi:hypothetical protein